MNDLEFIKNFQKITLTKICNDLKISRTNIVTGKGKKENFHKVRRCIENEIAKLYLLEEKDGHKTSTL